MAIFKCKMCGGALEINNNETIATCEYCGTQQTLPKLDDDRRANLYDRANHFRRNNEFDKAMGIYEQILNEDNTDAEAYWSLVLCRYGIEYVEDPTSHKRVPTVNRAQYTAVFDDDNYKSALQYADSFQRNIYEEEANTINEIQKGILAISQQEEPFDVFICYKETDNNGRRTMDSVLANDLYHQLTQEGFKVFFARITLEDKLGSAYEPYIFAALNSAKVMVVLGTKPEYFRAVWVRNEWSRYLALIKQGQQKMLIPAYKDMDPYDLPEEFSHLQAQDMSKLGFMQDLIRGIKKIVQVDESKANVMQETIITNTNTIVAPLLRRAFMFLEDENWSSANEYCEKVLDIDPENAEAYLGKLMVEIKINMRSNLGECNYLFDDNKFYQKAMRFADENLIHELTSYIDKIKARIEESRLNDTYNKAKTIMMNASEEKQYKDASELFESIRSYRDAEELSKICIKAVYVKAKQRMAIATEKSCSNTLEELYQSISELGEVGSIFKSISDYEDSSALAQTCSSMSKEVTQKAQEQAEINRKDKILADGKTQMKSEDAYGYEAARNILLTIPGWKDADEKIEECKKKIEEIKAKKEEEQLKREREEKRIHEEKALRAKKRKRNAIIILSSVCVIAVVTELIVFFVIPNKKYNEAVKLMNEGKNNEAIIAFQELGGYKDSEIKINECEIAILNNKYDSAMLHMQNKQYAEAADIFLEIEGHKDSKTKYKEARYQLALTYWNDKNFEKSNPIFEEIITYKDSKDKIHVHDYIVELLTEPACETAGQEQFSCKECSYSYVQEIEKTGHSFEGGTVTKKPTCTENGERKYTCASCGNNVTEEIAMIDHSYTSTVTKAATCESNGVRTYTCNCGKSYTETINATGHNYDSGKVTTQATCDKDGIKTYTCGCGKSYTETISATGHNYDGKVTTQATCDKDGIKTYTCGCGKSYTEVIEKTGHAYSEVTCTSASSCSKCGHVLQAALGHDNQEYRCSRCDINLSGTFSVVLDSLNEPEANFKGIPLDYKHASGMYKITIIVLETNDTVRDEYNCVYSPHIGVDYGFLISVGGDDVQPGDVFIEEVYHDGVDWIEGDVPFTYYIRCCKAEITIEPIS